MRLGLVLLCWVGWSRDLRFRGQKYTHERTEAFFSSLFVPCYSRFNDDENVKGKSSQSSRVGDEWRMSERGNFHHLSSSSLVCLSSRVWVFWFHLRWADNCPLSRDSVSYRSPAPSDCNSSSERAATKSELWSNKSNPFLCFPSHELSDSDHYLCSLRRQRGEKEKRKNYSPNTSSTNETRNFTEAKLHMDMVKRWNSSFCMLFFRFFSIISSSRCNQFMTQIRRIRVRMCVTSSEWQ